MMGRTIIQPIGPLYGDVVNGTVFGRPNGSIYVPSTNTISLTIPDTAGYIRKRGGFNNIVDSCNSSGTLVKIHVIAESQDVAANVQIQVSTANTFLDDDTVSVNRTAGVFNEEFTALAIDATDFTITSGTTYYVRAVLMNNNTPVATSETKEVEGWEA